MRTPFFFALVSLWTSVALADVPLTWSNWVAKDAPSGNGDYEKLTDLHAAGLIPCTQPIAIEARRTRDKVPAVKTGEVVHLSTTTGFACTNRKQPDGRCDDYEVRVACTSPNWRWSPWISRDMPSGSGDHELVKGLFKAGQIACAEPGAVRARRVRDGVEALLAGERITLSLKGLACRNTDQPDGRCDDYAVRAACPEPNSPTHPPEPSNVNQGNSTQEPSTGSPEHPPEQHPTTPSP